MLWCYGKKKEAWYHTLKREKKFWHSLNPLTRNCSMDGMDAIMWHTVMPTWMACSIKLTLSKKGLVKLTLKTHQLLSFVCTYCVTWLHACHPCHIHIVTGNHSVSQGITVCHMITWVCSCEFVPILLSVRSCEFTLSYPAHKTSTQTQNWEAYERCSGIVTRKTP